ncbi:MAG: hypothetical protein IGS54_07800 [Elainella sp. C42_A2020_010]|nr:hypothetical protein [Elainella sp. C42_A2020_010]
MNINQTFSRVEEVSQALLERFLAPYKVDCRYLKQAHFQYPDRSDPTSKTDGEGQGIWFMKGEFAIPESCYIDDTGHFNSVEFNICYNQLFYIMIAYLVQHKLLKEMSDWDLDIYQRRQLNDFLIVKFSSTFKQPINSDAFQGALSINKCSTRNNLILIKTSCAFYDAKGWSEGDVTIAILNDQSNPKNLQQTVLSIP